MPALTIALKDKSHAVRKLAAETLGKIGPKAATAVLALTGLLRDSSERVRGAAAEALGRIGPKAAPAIPVLVRMLKKTKTPSRHAQEYPR